MRRHAIVIAASALLAFAVAAQDSPRTNGQAKPEDAYQELAVLMDVIALLRQDYVDTDKVTYRRLVQGALNGVMAELDPFSVYMRPQSYSRFKEDTEGKEFVGIGVEVAFNKEHKIEVVAPLEDMPAFKAGVRPADVILSIDGKSALGMSMRDCSEALMGPVGSEVKLSIFRPSEQMTTTIAVKRGKIEVPTVKLTEFPADKTAYLRITQFNAKTDDEVEKALAKLRADKTRGVVLDLRDNPGGLMMSAVDVCGHFLDEDKLVVSSSGRVKSQCQSYRTGASGLKLTTLPLVILVNRNSASAAEIVAGCLKDYGRAVLVGEKTFGKGSVQSLVPLDKNRGAVKLTTAEYLTPSRTKIHGVGVPPDITVEMGEEDAAKLFRQRSYHPGEVMPSGPDSVRDVQLERALEILKGILLYDQRKGG